MATTEGTGAEPTPAYYVTSHLKPKRSANIAAFHILVLAEDGLSEEQWRSLHETHRILIVDRTGSFRPIERLAEVPHEILHSTPPYDSSALLLHAFTSLTEVNRANSFYVYPTGNDAPSVDVPCYPLKQLLLPYLHDSALGPVERHIPSTSKTDRAICHPRKDAFSPLLPLQEFSLFMHATHLESAERIGNEGIRPQTLTSLTTFPNPAAYVAGVDTPEPAYGPFVFAGTMNDLCGQFPHAYLIEMIEFQTSVAARILLSKEAGKDLPPTALPYNPTVRGGPWYYDQVEKKHYRFTGLLPRHTRHVGRQSRDQLTFTLEFMVDGTIPRELLSASPQYHKECRKRNVDICNEDFSLALCKLISNSVPALNQLSTVHAIHYRTNGTEDRDEAATAALKELSQATSWNSESQLWKKLRNIGLHKLTYEQCFQLFEKRWSLVELWNNDQLVSLRDQLLAATLCGEIRPPSAQLAEDLKTHLMNKHYSDTTLSQEICLVKRNAH